MEKPKKRRARLQRAPKTGDPLIDEFHRKMEKMGINTGGYSDDVMDVIFTPPRPGQVVVVTTPTKNAKPNAPEGDTSMMQPKLPKRQHHKQG